MGLCHGSVKILTMAASKTLNILTQQEIKPCASGRDYIDELADKVAHKIGYGPGSNIASLIVERLGGEILKAEDTRQADLGYMIDVRGEGDFTICLSPYLSRMRNRFALAHELGHYFLHSEMGNRRLRIEQESGGEVDQEADWFAIGLLMPRSEFRQLAYEMDEEELAVHFDVTPSMVKDRLAYFSSDTD